MSDRNTTAELVDDFLKALSRAEVGANASKRGDVIPPFVLPDSEGRLVSSDQLTEKGPFVLSFIRGNWCTICESEIDDLLGVWPRLERAGYHAAIVTPEIGGGALRLSKRHSLPFPVLSDVDNGVALLFGLLFRLSDEMRKMFLRVGRNLPELQGNDGWFLPIPATYIVDRDGTIQHAFVDVDYRRRMPPEDIADQVESLSRD